MHAIELATTHNATELVDIEHGTTIYIDLEMDGFLSVPRAVNYLEAWFNTIRTAGYRPGVYCLNPPANVHPAWTSDGPLVRQKFPDVAIWFVRIPRCNRRSTTKIVEY
jgi:hypothetical protein